MTAFLYFLPDRKFLLAEDVRSLPCAYAFDRPDLAQTVAHEGPSGGPGIVIAETHRIRSARVKFDRAAQRWIETPHGFWIGYWLDAPPTEETLRRSRLLDGRFVELADERSWLVPRARHWSEEDSDPNLPLHYSCDLPSRVTMRDGRIVVGDPIPRYAELWRIQEAVFAVRLGTATEDQRRLCDGEWAWHLCARVLGANYVVSLAEAMLLELFTTESPTAVFDALLDWETFSVLQKKRMSRLAELSSYAGPPEG